MFGTTGQIPFNRPPPHKPNGQFQDREPFDEGVNEAVKDLVREEEKSRQRLEDLVEKSSEVLFKISSTFPFDLFPKDIIIDENKVSIIYREFFWCESIQSIMIKDVSDVIVETNPFFATLIILGEGFKGEPVKINYLWKKEAIRARKIIQGLMVSLRGLSSPMLGSVEVTHLPANELIGKLESLGEAEK